MDALLRQSPGTPILPMPRKPKLGVPPSNGPSTRHRRPDNALRSRDNDPIEQEFLRLCRELADLQWEKMRDQYGYRRSPEYQARSPELNKMANQIPYLKGLLTRVQKGHPVPVKYRVAPMPRPNEGLNKELRVDIRH
jgi:hypothetical protein